MADLVWHEIKCCGCNLGTSKNGETFILVQIDLSYLHTIIVICPLCHHRMKRLIERGAVSDLPVIVARHSLVKEWDAITAAQGRPPLGYNIRPPAEACSKQPRHGPPRPPVGEEARDDWPHELWADYHGLPPQNGPVV